MKRLLCLLLLASLLTGCLGPDQQVGPTAIPTQSLGGAPTATKALPSAVPSVPYPTAVGTQVPPVKTHPPDAKPTATATATATGTATPTPPAPLPTQVPTLPAPVGTLPPPVGTPR